MKHQPTLWRRLKNAAKAFRETPRPQFKPMYERISLPGRVVASTAKYSTHYTDSEAYKKGVKDAAKERIANSIGRELLQNGCIVFQEDACEMQLVGKVYVFVPEEAKRWSIK